MTVLLVDNFDSFTFNLAHLVRRCGHDVDVVPNTMEVRRDAGEVSHVIISPGPGSPHRARDIGRCHEVLDRYLTAAVARSCA